jgi:ABC-2 type transport system permease protein
MRYLRLLGQFIRASAQQELAYRANFFISLLHSVLNLGTGVLGLVVLFSQVETIRGWDFPSTLALLGVYLLVGALRGLVIGPSLDALAGIDGEVWSGKLDFTLLRPVDVQFLVSLRYWRLFALVDLVLALAVLGAAITRAGLAFTPDRWLAFLIALFASLTVMYALLLIFAAFVFLSAGVLFTWVFDALYQMARYPVGIYPGWLRLALTWVVPVGIMTTVPAQALSGGLPPGVLAGAAALALALLAAASLLFRLTLRRYASASS